jgi:hypothetical protein
MTVERKQETVGGRTPIYPAWLTLELWKGTGNSRFLQTRRVYAREARAISSSPTTMAAVNISQILTDTLSPDANTRIAAELKLSEVLTHQGWFS